MNLKTYTAGSMSEALLEVKKDLGKDAVILHTRVYKSGGVMGVGARQVVEITAADSSHAHGPRIKDSATPARSLSASSPRRRPPVSAQPVLSQATLVDDGAGPETPIASEFELTEFRKVGGHRSVAVAGDEPEETDRVGAEPVSEQQALASEHADAKRKNPPVPELPVSKRESVALPKRATPAVNTSRGLATAAPIAPADATAVDDLRSELASIKRLVGRVLDASRPSGIPLVSTDAMLDLKALLSDVGVENSAIEAVFAKLCADLSPAELADAAALRVGAISALASLFTASGDSIPRLNTTKSSPTVIALVGPTGVGKTTTIAKLAATYKLRKGRSVGLVTADTYRIAAVEQLRTYATIIGLPFKVAMTPADVASSITALAECDVILLDTAGRSQMDSKRLAELAELLSAAKPDETHLVLSVAAADSVIAKAAERFSQLSPSRVILTKLDEAVLPGSIVNTARKVGLPISFVTVGQEVPDHLEVADPTRLARRILDPVSETME